MAAFLIAACASVPSMSSPAPLATAPVIATETTVTASPRAASYPLLPGQHISLRADGDMTSFFADGGSLIAWVPRNQPPPFRDRIQRADPPAGPWRTIFSDDAHFRLQRVTAGRMAIVEYREDGEGAYNETVVVLDLSTGGSTTIDRYALSKATFRGGGGAPRRPVGQVALGRDMIAWTRVLEGPGGTVEGELRVASLADPRNAAVIARSTEWLEPIAVDARSVTYVIGGADHDEVRSRDLSTGLDRPLSMFASPTQVSGRGAPARSGAWVGWLEESPAPSPKRAVPPNVTLRALNIVSGDERSMDAGGASCSALTANAVAFAWTCRTSADQPATLQALDVGTWKLVDIVRASGTRAFGLQAVDRGFLWTDSDGTTRDVHLFTPAAGVFGEP